MASALQRSPLAPSVQPNLPALSGVRLATAEAGIKYRDRTDLLMMVFDRNAAVAGVFTRSRCPGAPVDWCRDRLARPAPTCRAFVVNSGNANAFTGRRGKEATRLTAETAAAALGCEPDDILLASTGVIGEPLDATRFEAHFEPMVERLSDDRWAEAAKAIMTTDTFEKMATATADLGGTPVTINGIAKGSGMIAPDMATMLGFIVTDAPVAQPVLQDTLSRLTRQSFNAITVDSDTSTSDTVLLAATGLAQCPAIDTVDDPRFGAFEEALLHVMQNLARQIVRDGEGATKLMEISVEGAASDEAAFRIAMAIGNSPLVKTAVAGEDANWGRIVMAVGKAGEEADRDRLAIHFGPVRVAVNGERDPDYSEDEAAAVMKRDEIPIRVNLGLGNGKATIFACDLTHGYVSINGDYRS